MRVAAEMFVAVDDAFALRHVNAAIGAGDHALGLARRTAETYAPRQFDRMERELERLSMLASDASFLYRTGRGRRMDSFKT